MVILRVVKFKGTMRKVELLMLLSFLPFCCSGTAHSELMFDSTAGQACKDSEADSRLCGSKVQESDCVTPYMDMT